jgi:hypothetical protein
LPAEACAPPARMMKNHPRTPSAWMISLAASSLQSCSQGGSIQMNATGKLLGSADEAVPDELYRPSGQRTGVLLSRSSGVAAGEQIDAGHHAAFFSERWTTDRDSWSC